MQEQFTRTALLLGEEGIHKLNRSRVAIFGIGGVGGYTVEALARSGVGHFLLVDNDKVALSNLNRQIIATLDNVGRYKTQVMKERILSINPEAEVETCLLYTSGIGTHEELLATCGAYQEIARSQLSEAELKGGSAS